MSRYSLSTSTSSVGFTGTPLRARQRLGYIAGHSHVHGQRCGAHRGNRFVKNGAKLRKNN